MKEKLKKLIDAKMNAEKKKLFATKGQGDCAYHLGKLAGYTDIYAELCENEEFEYED